MEPSWRNIADRWRALDAQTQAVGRALLPRAAADSSAVPPSPATSDAGLFKLPAIDAPSASPHHLQALAILDATPVALDQPLPADDAGLCALCTMVIRLANRRLTAHETRKKWQEPQNAQQSLAAATRGYAWTCQHVLPASSAPASAAWDRCRIRLTQLGGRIADIRRQQGLEAGATLAGHGPAAARLTQ